MAKNVITEEQRQEAARLKSIFTGRAKSLNLTQEKMAVKLGGSGQSTASNYLNGQTALNLKTAIIFAKELGVEVAEFSPRLAELMNYKPESDQIAIMLEKLAQLPEASRSAVHATIDAFLLQNKNQSSD